MSITFQVEPGDVIGFAVSCGCMGSEVIVFGAYVDASEFAQSGQYSFAGCDDSEYCLYPMVEAQFENSQDTVSVNMSNSNAFSVLETLGVDVHDQDYAGSFDADDLLARINIGLAVSLESAEIPTFADGNMVFGGRPEGYVQNRLYDIVAAPADHEAAGPYCHLELIFPSL